MPPGLEDQVAAEWIVSVLSADAVLMGAAPGGLWDGPALEAPAYPSVVFGPMSPGLEVRGVATTTIMLNGLWLIRGVTDTIDYGPVVTIASHIYTDLHGSHDVTTADGIIVACVREQAFRMETVQGGRPYRHYGGIYRIFSQAT